MAPTDGELIDAYRLRQDRSALDGLLRRHLGPIRNLVFQMVLNHTLADDLTQDIFLRVVRGLRSFSGRSEFSTWIHRIALNTVYSHLHQGRRHRWLPSPEREPPSNGRDAPDAVAVRCETVATLEQALQELSPPLRAALVLTCLHGKSAAEVADIEDCAIGTIYSRVHAARQQLRKRLGDTLP